MPQPVHCHGPPSLLQMPVADDKTGDQVGERHNLVRRLAKGARRRGR
ncbi:MAG TPA: hypothetical protein VF297_31780 [Pyrinomonadaceae bacterium]